MNKSLILDKLQQLTGSLKPAPGASVDELPALQRSLAEQLAADPAFTVSGNRLHHAVAEVETFVDLSTQFSHLSDLLNGITPTQVTGPAPLVFRRETDFSSSLLGNSVPLWGSGMAPTKTYGPFLDEHGLQVWFDFYFPIRLVQVFLQGSPTPTLLIPLWGTVSGQQSYVIERGSIWIASELIARVSGSHGYYTGSRSKLCNRDCKRSGF
jgi:hypothetical protein